MASQREMLQQTIQAHKEVLAKLEYQVAGIGELHAPPGVLVQLDRTREEISRLEQQLAALPPDAPAPASFDRAARFEKNVIKALDTFDELNNELANETRTIDKNRIKDNIEMIKGQYISAVKTYVKMGGDPGKYPPDLD